MSLDGQVINAGGSYTGGSAAFKTGVMSRSSDIASLDKAISEILKNSKELNEKIAEKVVEGYKKIEAGVVGGYQKIEEGTVSGFN